MITKTSFQGVPQKRKLKEKIYSYIFNMKQGEENRVACRIADDIEIYVLDLNTQIGELDDYIVKLKNQIKRLQKQGQNNMIKCKHCGTKKYYSDFYEKWLCPFCYPLGGSYR